MKKQNLLRLAVAGALAVGAQGAWAASACPDLLTAAGGDFSGFSTAVKNTVTTGAHNFSGAGAGNAMWVTLMANDGTVCAVVSTGTEGKATAGAGTGVGTTSWLLSRIISAQKANTSNGLSTNSAAVPTGGLFTVTQDGGRLFGLQFSNPVDPAVAYKGSENTFGTASDPLKNKRIGGVNVFGGGLALYSSGGKKIGAIGVSGDTSCEDHSVAFKIRKALNLQPTLSGNKDDRLPVNGSVHPTCSDVGTLVTDSTNANNGWK